jgi:hypothetical protein
MTDPSAPHAPGAARGSVTPSLLQADTPKLRRAVSPRIRMHRLVRKITSMRAVSPSDLFSALPNPDQTSPE